MLNIPELVPPWNQFQQFRESVPKNSYHTRNQLPLIPTESRNLLQFRPITRCINSQNSARFRNRTEFLPIPGMGSDSGIPNRNHTSAFTLMHCDMLEGYSIWTQSHSGQESRESYRDGITRNCTEFQGIPTNSGIQETGSDSEIPNRNHTSALTLTPSPTPTLTPTPSIPGIQPDSGIARNSGEFLPILEFLTGIGSSLDAEVMIE
jgi:hypothetical protein